MNKASHGEASLLSALSPDKRMEAGKASVRDLKEGTARFYDEFLEDNLKADRDEAERKDLQVNGETPARSMMPEQRNAAGKVVAKDAVEAREPGSGSSPNLIHFTNTKPDSNGLTPQQRKELGKQHARTVISHSGNGC